MHGTSLIKRCGRREEGRKGDRGKGGTERIATGNECSGASEANRSKRVSERVSDWLITNVPILRGILPIVQPKRVSGAAMMTDSETHTNTYTYTHTQMRGRN